MWCVKDGVPRLRGKVPRRHRRPIPAQARHQSQPSAISATPATQNEGRCLQVTKCHACHAKRRWMSPSATPATQSAAASPAASPASNPVQARHQSQPSALSATPATQNEGGCHACHAKRRPYVPKCHACHAK